MSKSKFNSKVCSEIIVSFENGLPLRSAAAIAGVSYNTVKNWLKKGEEEEFGEFRDFFNRMEEAKAKFIAYHINFLNNSDKDSTHKWLLEVADPEHFKKVERVEHSGEIKTINTNVELDKELLDSIIEDKKDKLGSVTSE